LFTDVEVSTRLWDQEPDAMGAALARHDEILREGVVAHGGHLVKGRGDGVHAVFETADAAVRAAVACGLAMNAAQWVVSEPLRVRIGIHTGVAELRDGDYFGSAVNRAARLEGIAHGGQIVCSQATADLVRDTLPDGVALMDLGEHRLRDLSRPERVYQVSTTGLDTSFPPLRSLDAALSNLPLETSSFIGRDHELVQVAEALEQSRVVTLVGVGGVGKTRLALQAAAERLPDFADGVWLCELAGADDARSMHQLVAATLNIASRPGLGVRDSVVEYLGPKTLLLLLDNCEHVIDAAAELAQLVVAGCPHVRVLATSREPLAVDGERVRPVGSLATADEASAPTDRSKSDAVRLFLERAAEAQPEARWEDTDLFAIMELCRRLDGIPLAIELAAARVSSMTPGEIAGHLDERFRLLAGRRRGTVERHQTMRATVDWSYSLLEENERRVFDRLGVFAGSFTADAAVAVAGEDLDSWDILDALGALTSKSMLVADTTSDGVARYRMLETMRHYARERLGSADEEAEHWWARHAEYYAELARQVGDALLGPDELAWRRRLAAELDDLRAAVNWSLDTPADDCCIRIVAALNVQAAQYDTAGIGAWALQCEGRAGDASPGLRAAVLGAATWERFRSGDSQSITSALEALRDGLPPGWPSSYIPHMSLAAALLTQGRFEDANAAATEGHRALDAAAAPPSGHTHLHAIQVGLIEDTLEMRQHGDDALSNARESANPTALAVGWWAVSTSRSVEQPDEAYAAMQKCLTLIRRGAGDGVFTPGLGLAAALASRLGDFDEALTLLREAVLYGRDAGNRVGVFTAVDFAVQVFADRERYDIAATLAGAFETIGLASGNSLAERRQRVEKVEQAHTVLGDTAFAEAFGRGASMSYNEVLEYLLDQTGRDDY
jgi:predicted ATPase